MTRDLSSSSLDELTELLAEAQLAIRRICASSPDSALRGQLESWQDLRRRVRQELQDRTHPPPHGSACDDTSLDSRKGVACP